MKCSCDLLTVNREIVYVSRCHLLPIKYWNYVVQLLIHSMFLVMCTGEMATKIDEERVSSLFKAIGKIWTAEEKYFDAITGLRYSFRSRFILFLIF